MRPTMNQTGRPLRGAKKLIVNATALLFALFVLVHMTACGGGGATSQKMTVTAISPSQISTAGGQIALTGTNFTPDVTVQFGGVAAQKVYFQSSTLITAVSSAVSAPTTVDVTVTSKAGGTVTLSQALKFVTPAPPTQNGCTTLPCTYQAADPANTLVGSAAIGTCTGCPNGIKVGSLGYGSDVIINNVYAPSDGNYTLTIVGCEGGGTEDYQLIVDGGSAVTIPLSGSNWNAPAAPVTVTIPLKAGSSNTVELGNATAYSPDVVSIEVSAPVSTAPITVTSLTPNQVPLAGGQITFAGTNFTSDVTVSFGGVSAPTIFVSSTQFTATAPATTTAGAVDVVVSSAGGGTVTLSKALTYTQPTSAQCGALPCTYQATDPSNTLSGGAAIGTCTNCPNGIKVGSLGYGADVTFNHVFAPVAGNYTLTIVGCEGGGTQNYQVVVNGGAPATVPLTGSDWNTPAAPVSITVALQAGNNNTVELGNATDWSPDVVSIEVSAATTTTLPTITSITPNQLPITGGQVVLTGTNFTAGSTVTFGGVAAPSVSFLSATQLNVMAPASANAGAVDVTVNTTTNGAVTAPKALTYVEQAACTGATCIYQAWDPQNTLAGGAKAAACAGCQYGVKVGGLGKGASVTINNVYAPATGTYILTLVGCEGGGTQDYQVIVNGGLPITVPLFGNNWYVQSSPVSTMVTLQAGSTNTIQIGNSATWSPDAVYVVVSPANVAANPGAAQPIVMSSGQNQVTYDLSTGLATFAYNGVTKIADFYSEGYNGPNLYQSTSSVYTRTAATGNNGETDITLTPSDGSPVMVQRFILSNNHFLVQVELDGTNLSSNEMSPIVVNQVGAVDLGSYADTRFLQVPFDNDAWVTYNAESSNGISDTSYEVGAFYDNTSRNGLIVGSVTHDTWKTGIEITGNSNKLDGLWVYGGANSPWDSLPHSAVTGNKITSPTVMVGYYSDWRSGMEDFANTNAQITPMLSWSGPAPMGSAGSANMTNISLTSVEAVEDYFHAQLPSFTNQGVSYFDVDANWPDLSDQDLQAYAAHAHSQGQKAGAYWTPWIVWNWTSLTDPVDGAPDYTYNDIVLKDANGNPLAAVDGAYGVDPTSPGAKERVDFYTAKFKNAGLDYVKLDFLSHGMLEGGSNNGAHYDRTVQTGLQAYNQGMTYLNQQLGTSMFIDESIAPVFPYQYGHARRVSCDTYGSISQTSYEMNSASYAWWLAGRLYQWNDPDNIRLETYTSNENKTRVTSTAIEGYMLDSDNVTDSAAPPLAQQWLTNTSINGLPALGLNFRPVEGNTGTSPVNVLVAQNGTTYYLAVFNFDGSNAATPTVDLSRAGLGSGTFSVTDLWTGAASSATGTLNVTLNPAESTILKLQPLN